MVEAEQRRLEFELECQDPLDQEKKFAELHTNRFYYFILEGELEPDKDHYVLYTAPIPIELKNPIGERFLGFW